MNTIYSVSCGEYSDFRVIAYFSTIEKAREYLRDLRQKCLLNKKGHIGRNNSLYDIQEEFIDDPDHPAGDWEQWNLGVAPDFEQEEYTYIAIHPDIQLEAHR